MKFVFVDINIFLCNFLYNFTFKIGDKNKKT